MLMAAALLALGLSGQASAQSRGIEVALKASEAPDAAVLEIVRLYGASHALVIGIDDYTNGWPRLSNGVNDARAVAAELESRGFDVTLRTDIDSVELKRAFEEFYVVKGADPEARLFVWFSGHGATVGEEAFLVPADAPPPQAGPRFKLAALSLRRFGEFVRLAESKHALAVFDSCFAGTIFDSQRALPPPAITRATTLAVRQFLTSGDAGQTVSDDGTFRKLFLRALRGEERANANGDGYLTASELGLFLSDRMVNLRLGQTPRYGKLRDPDYDRGDFVFVLPDAEGGTSAPAAEAGVIGVDMQVWREIKDSRDPTIIATYVESFPLSPMARFARRRLEELIFVDKVLMPGKTALQSNAIRELHRRGIYSREQVIAFIISRDFSLLELPDEPGDVFRECGVCPQMVVIPAGEFVMGSPESEERRDPNEGPQHTVRIDPPLALGRHEVTRAEFAAFVRASGHISMPCVFYPKRFSEEVHQSERHPVACVSWVDAKAYVRWLSERTGNHYRLPSEAEWEYAARAGTTTRYHWGDEIGRGNTNCGGGCGDDFRDAAQAGSFVANAFGLHDMLGNVWEWTEDCWNGSYEGAPDDGSAWRSGDCHSRILRGGAWIDVPRGVRAGNRSWDSSVLATDYIGFRVARTLD